MKTFSDPIELCSLYLFLAPRKGIRIPKSGKQLLLESGIPGNFFMESGILGFGIRSTA